jgi:glycerate kinase
VRILIAPDKFKGSLSAKDVAQNIAAGLREILPDARIDIIAMADGGEGTAEVICDALSGRWITTAVHDPLGKVIEARYARIEKNRLAIIEMSEAAGMRRLTPNEYDVDLASTFGVGEMLLDAARHDAREIIVGLGGSATNDGGFGLARALGFKFFDKEDRELNSAVSELQKLERIVAPVAAGVSPANSSASQPARLPPQLRIIAAVDVRNPLLGKNGATRVFGPQKGATPDKIGILERALTHLADIVAQTFEKDLRDVPGAGAAGGLGFGLMTFCNAIIRPGFDVVAEGVDLESKMKDADLVITGEGSLDRQTLEGKTPAGVVRLARKLGKRVFAIVGRASRDRDVRELFDGVYELGGSIAQAPELLREKARELANRL